MSEVERSQAVPWKTEHRRLYGAAVLATIITPGVLGAGVGAGWARSYDLQANAEAGSQTAPVDNSDTTNELIAGITGAEVGFGAGLVLTLGMDLPNLRLRRRTAKAESVNRGE